jgi:hypothetical protein
MRSRCPIVTQEQPRHPAGLAKGNPLTKGLVFATYPIGKAMYDAVTGSASTSSDADAVRRTVDGNKALSSEINGSSVSWPQYGTKFDSLIGAFSMFADGSLEDNGTSRIIARSFSTVSGNGIAFKFDDSDLATNGFYFNTDNNNRSSSNFDALGADSELYRHRAMITCDGTTANFYAKGALDRSVADAGIPTAGTDRGTEMLLGGGAIALFLAYNRILTLVEYQALYMNPWQVFESPARRIRPYVAAGGGGGGGNTFFNRIPESLAFKPLTGVY